MHPTVRWLQRVLLRWHKNPYERQRNRGRKKQTDKHTEREGNEDRQIYRERKTETDKHTEKERRRTNLVFLSWSLIFFSISASVSVSRKGHHWSASDWLRIATSTTGNGASLNNTHITTAISHTVSNPVKYIMVALEESLVTVPPTAPLILQEDWSQDEEKNEENTEKIHKYSLLLTDSVPALHKFTWS